MEEPLTWPGTEHEGIVTPSFDPARDEFLVGLGVGAGSGSEFRAGGFCLCTLRFPGSAEIQQVLGVSKVTGQLRPLTLGLRLG